MKSTKILVAFAVIASLMILPLHTGIAMAKGTKAAPKTTTITGTVEQEGADYVIKKGKTTYAVTGQDVSSMVGKKVAVTGTLSKGEKGKTIEATKVTEAKAKKAAKTKK